MSKLEGIIEVVDGLDEFEIVEYDFKPLWEKARAMESAMKTFVERVEAGTIRSTRTYTQFKEILDAE